MEIFLDR